MNGDGNRSQMKMTTDKKNSCPICNCVGVKVSFSTVFSLTKQYLKHTLTQGDYFLCTAKNCLVAYYNRFGRTIYASDIECEIWLKEYRKKTMICYCRDISLDDVVFAVSRKDLLTIPKVVHFLQKSDCELNCIEKSPVGDSCEKLFSNAIEYAKKLKNIK